MANACLVWKGPNLSIKHSEFETYDRQISQQIYPHFSSQIIQVKYLSCDATISCADISETKFTSINIAQY